MKRPEFGLYWPPYVIAALMLLFTGIAWIVFRGYSRAFDTASIVGLRDLLDAAGATWMGEAARDVTSLGSVVVVCIVVGSFIGYLVFNGSRRSAILMLVSVAGGLVLNDVLKLVFDRPRPDLALPSIRVFTSGFPSGHAALSTVAYLTMASLLAQGAPAAVKRYIMWTAIILVFLIGISRIYLGVHYPTDVMAGWCVGAAWTITCWFGAQAIEQRRSRTGWRHR